MACLSVIMQGMPYPRSYPFHYMDSTITTYLAICKSVTSTYTLSKLSTCMISCKLNGAHTHNCLTALCPALHLVGQYQKKHSPTQSFSTASLWVLFGLLGLEVGTLHFILYIFFHPVIIFSQHMPKSPDEGLISEIKT